MSIRSKRYLTQAESAKQDGSVQEQKRLSKLAEQDRSAALALAARAVKESRATDSLAKVKALFNLVSLSPLPKAYLKETAKQNYLNQAVAVLEQLPDSGSKAQALIQLSIQNRLAFELKIKSLEQAITVAKNIGDTSTESFALGHLGNVYELEGQFSKAMELTHQAQFVAQQVSAKDSLYRWQWQAGRIYKTLGNLEKAISSYKQAIATLQSTRSDIVTANKDLQFDVRDQVEPVYRELLTLLLDNGQNKPGNIKEAVRFSGLLKLSELQSFFGDDCLEIAQTIGNYKNPLVQNNEVVINSIILNKKTFIILHFPDGLFKTYPVSITARELQREIGQLRLSLEDIATDKYLAKSQKLYDLLIRPMAAELAKTKPSTLIFINDGVLRNIPMAALHDGKRFLVEQYPIAARISEGLITPNKRSKNKPALVFGLTAAVSSFDALPYVNHETKIVQNILGGSRFLNKDFTLIKFKDKIKEDYPIIHIATHGKFGGTYTNTFLQAFDTRISLEELEEAILSRKEPIDLLTLSACQTAAGDNRSTLGFAGIAVRTGVRSVLATLWFVNDADTVPLIKDFYTQLHQSSKTKAEALRNAQMKLIADPRSHPAMWSSFILVGNWS